MTNQVTDRTKPWAQPDLPQSLKDNVEAIESIADEAWCCARDKALTWFNVEASQVKQVCRERHLQTVAHAYLKRLRREVLIASQDVRPGAYADDLHQERAKEIYQERYIAFKPEFEHDEERRKCQLLEEARTHANRLFFEELRSQLVQLHQEPDAK